MKQDNQIYKALFLVVILVFGVATLYGVKNDEAPRLILFLGRFHPLLLHMPIGALIVTFFIDTLGRIQKNYPYSTVKNLLGFTAILSIMTCFLGYFLSLEGGYQKDTLDLHLYTGIGTAVLASILFFISLKPEFKANKLFLPLFIVTLICISVAGHYGSILTHGDNFLTEYASIPEEEKTIEVVDSLKMYNDVVAKILDKKCVQCHNTSKQKGELSLISPEAILKGGENGTSVIEGNALGSLLFSRTQLPISDEEHMPPEGKEQLTKDEIWLIEHWINNKLDFENYATKVADNNTLRQKLKKYLVFNAIEIPKASLSDIEDVQQAGFRVLELVPGKAELNIKLLKPDPSKASIEKLELLSEQIIELELNDSNFNDEMASILKRFKNLKSVRLDKTLITDSALKNLKNLESLQVLNIYNTSVSNSGLTSLLESIQPSTIYAWQTQIDTKTAIDLIEKHNVDIQYTILDGFVDSQLEAPFIASNKTIFTDTIHVTIESRLKDVEIRYTLNGEIPTEASTLFKETLVLDNSEIIKARVFKKDWKSSEVLKAEYSKIQQKITDFSVKIKPNKSYPDTNKLFDLEEGTLGFKDGNWVGYFGKNLITTIDLGTIKKVNNISISCLEDIGSWILYPTAFIVYSSNSKNGSFKKAGNIEITRTTKSTDLRKQKFTVSFSELKGRYFKLEVRNHEKLPDWHPSAGNPSWLFVDEILFW